MSEHTTETILSDDVASPSGTFAMPYPAGTDQSSFTGNYAASGEYIIVNGNDRYDDDVDDLFDVSYDATEITVTNKTGATLPAGSTVLLTAKSQLADITVTGTYEDDEAQIQAILNTLIATVRALGGAI